MIELLLVGVVTALAIIAFFKKKTTMAKVSYVILMIVLLCVIILSFSASIAVVTEYSGVPGIPTGLYVKKGEIYFPITDFPKGTPLYIITQGNQLFFKVSVVIVLLELIVALVGIVFAALAVSRIKKVYHIQGHIVEVHVELTTHTLIVDGEVKNEVKKLFATGLEMQTPIENDVFSVKFGIGFWSKSVKATYQGRIIS